MDDHRDHPAGTDSAALDHLTELAAQVLGVPVVCASLVDADRRLLTSSYGLSVPTALLISWSFMRRVVASGRPLVVTDGRRDPLVGATPVVRDGTVAAYVGMPLVARHGRTVGALSVMDAMPRGWSARQLDLLRKFAARIVGVSGLAVPGRGLRRVTRQEWNTVKRAGGRPSRLPEGTG